VKKKSKNTVEVLGTKINIEAPQHQFHCSYCGSKFIKEQSLLVHSCEKKKRWESRNDVGNRLGFLYYDIFREMCYPYNRKHTFSDFVESGLYLPFVKFGWWVHRSNLISGENYVKWLISQKIKIDSWTKESVYERFIKETLITEPIGDALSRSIESASSWAKESNNDFSDIFRKGSQFRICSLIKSGWLSPWTIYGSESGLEFLETLNQEQLDLIWENVNSKVWARIIKDRNSDFQYVREILLTAGW
jgi:hypothetical protein